MPLALFFRTRHSNSFTDVKGVTVCYSMLQCVTVCYSMLQYVAVCYSILLRFCRHESSKPCKGCIFVTDQVFLESQHLTTSHNSPARSYGPTRHVTGAKNWGATPMGTEILLIKKTVPGWWFQLLPLQKIYDSYSLGIPIIPN